MRLRFGHQHLHFCPILAFFVYYYSLFWGPGVISTINEPLLHLRVGHQHSQFWPILARFLDYYLVMGSRNDPGLCLRVGQQHSQFWQILTCSVDYYSLFSGPEVISIVVEPQGALTCRSSILIVLADSGPYHGLLLTFLGPRSDFHD